MTTTSELSIWSKESSIPELKEKFQTFLKQRDWVKFHNFKNISMSISIEASELMELFQWSLSDEEIQNKLKSDPGFHREVTMELADIVIYCMSLATKLGVEFEEIIAEKMTINEKRFPVLSNSEND